MAVFHKTPLVELIAAMRWETASGDSAWHLDFAALAETRGFVCRPSTGALVECGPGDQSASSPVFRLARDMLSVHALPPIRGWAPVEPQVRIALDLLHDARRRHGRAFPSPVAVWVRYIDAFDAPYLRGASAIGFLADTLGLRLDLPPALLRVCADPSEVVPEIRLAMPVAPGELVVVLTDRTRDAQPAVVMDTTVTVTRDIGWSAEGTMAALLRARGVIHEIFVELTEKLHQVMTAPPP